MPPRFSKSTVAMLKATLRSRASEGYQFSEDDVADLVGRTGLDATQIRNWNVHANRYYTTESQKANFLAGNDKVIIQPLQNHNLWVFGNTSKDKSHLSILFLKSYNII